MNLLLDVGFNREVAEDTALYWNKQPGNLASLIDRADNMNAGEITELGEKSSQRVVEAYSWQHIADEYNRLLKYIKF